MTNETREKVEIPHDEPRQIVCTGEAGSDVWNPAFGTWEFDDFGMESDEPLGDGERLFVNRRLYDALLAENEALKAAQVACVEPHEIERIIWSAMSWSYRHAAQLQAIGDEDIPDYDESGNSNAELAARVAAQRILSTLTMRSEAEALERGFWAGRACGGKKAEIDAALEKLKREAGQ